MPKTPKSHRSSTEVYNLTHRDFGVASPTEILPREEFNVELKLDRPQEARRESQWFEEQLQAYIRL